MRTSSLFQILYFTAILGLIGCSDMDATYVPHIEDGKIMYPGKADSVRAYGGENRIQLSWLLIDPDVTRVKIYWSNRSDSLEIPVEPSPGADSMSVILSDMEEGSYAFEFYTYDEQGNESVKAEVPGQVYGEDYISSLLGKPVQRITPGVDVTLIDWGEATEDVISTEVEYTDRKGTTRHISVPVEDEITELPDLEWESSFRHRTLLLPDSTAIDTFYTDYETEEVPEPGQNFALNKPVDSSSDCSCGRIEEIVDGDYETYWQPLSSDRSDLNVWFNIDLETRHKLNEMHVYWTSVDEEIHNVGSYQLLVSDDEENWEVAFEKTAGEVAIEEKITFPEVIGRYIQLNITFDSEIILQTSAVELYYNNQ